MSSLPVNFTNRVRCSAVMPKDSVTDLRWRSAWMSDAPESELRELVRISRQMCFTEKALAGEVPIRVMQNINGIEINEI